MNIWNAVKCLQWQLENVEKEKVLKSRDFNVIYNVY